MDEYGIDSHKLMFHVPRVNDWLEGKTVYPIYIEIAPAGGCNHRCTFCAVDYIGYKVRYLDKEILKDRLAEMAKCGVKSIMYAGEGEPLLHKHIGEIVTHTKAVGIDVAITTNATALTEELSEQILSSVTWIKISINAGTPETYAKVHQTKPEHFNLVLKNLAKAARIKQDKNLACTLGAQIVLLPENCGEAVSLASKVKEAGADYLVIKPYSQHLMSTETMQRGYKDFKYSDFFNMNEELKKFDDDRFHVVFRQHTMAKLEEEERYYTVCQATPFFWAYIMASGDVYGCSAYLEDKRFLYGNIHEKSFREIWEGKTRIDNIHYVQNELNIEECRKNCRMDEVNRYLWDIKHPSSHVNFI